MVLLSRCLYLLSAYFLSESAHEENHYIFKTPCASENSPQQESCFQSPNRDCPHSENSK